MPDEVKWVAVSPDSPYDPASYQAGIAVGYVAAEMMHGKPSIKAETFPENVLQLDLIAMHFGYVSTAGEPRGNIVTMTFTKPR